MVYSTALEMRRPARDREFESHLLHQNVFTEKFDSVLRTLSRVSAKNEKGFWKSTESVPEARRRFYK